MSGNSIQKLQAIDPTVLKSLLELNAHVKRQTIANILDDQSGLTELIHDYDKFLAASEKSSLKDSLRQNLYSRMYQYKNKKKASLGSGNATTRTTETPPANEPGPNIDDQENADEESDSPATVRVSAKFHAQSVKRFEKRLENKGIRTSRDGFLIAPNGKKTSIPYEGVLNDFGRNIKKPQNFMLTEQEKKKSHENICGSQFCSIFDSESKVENGIWYQYAGYKRTFDIGN